MIKVVYDHQIFSVQKYGGISRYFAEISRRINSIPGFEARIIAPLYVSRTLRPGPSLVGLKSPSLPLFSHVRDLLNTTVGSLYNRVYRPDLVHETYYGNKQTAPARSPVVITVYDMIHELFPELYPGAAKFVALKHRSIKRADQVICISDKTRDDLIDIVNVDPAKVVTIHLGVDSAAFGSPGTSRSWKVQNKPFLLYVGDRFGYKNFIPFINAYAQSEVREMCDLVVFGGGDFNKAEVDQISSLGLRLGKQIQCVTGNDSALARYYLHAMALVYPSLYEGFGLPPLEAMRFGCPVICSNAGSLPEVVGAAAELFDPGDIRSMQLSIDKVAASPAYRESLSKRGFEQIERFTWERCASQTSELYRRLLGY